MRILQENIVFTLRRRDRSPASGIVSEELIVIKGLVIRGDPEQYFDSDQIGDGLPFDLRADTEGVLERLYIVVIGRQLICPLGKSLRVILCPPIPEISLLVELSSRRVKCM